MVKDGDVRTYLVLMVSGLRDGESVGDGNGRRIVGE